MSDAGQRISDPPQAAVAAPAVAVAQRGAMLALTLDRPAVLNAFNDDMCRAVAAEVVRAGRNPDIYVVALKSASAKAFCAGGDVRAVVSAAANDMARAKGYLAAEYSLNWALECFAKPTVSFINGLCMGSGAGLTLYNTHRIAGENYKFAMPETAIGLFPDVGVAHVLARLPWPIGLYLGLTGRMIRRDDAYWLGLATHCIAADKYASIEDQFADAEPIDPILDGLHESQAAGELRKDSARVAELFSAQSIWEIFAALEKASSAGDTFAQSALADLRKRSPVSLAITDRHIRSARELDLRETLIQDYRLAVRCLEGRDFKEGVRAALIDKDGAPRWQHASIEDVTEREVASYFAPLTGGELDLPMRSAMQNARNAF